MLFVVGDLRAKNIFNLGCRIIVNGNVETGAFICSPRHHELYRSASAHVTGRLSADAIAGPISACDGATSQIFRSGQRHKKMDELGFFNDEARSFFDPQLMQGDALLLPRVREYLEQGRLLSSGTESSGQAESFLDEVPDDIKTLDLSGRRLSLLPDRLFELQQLEQLDLSDNELTGPDPRLATLTKLEDLNVQDNRWGSYDGLGVVVELAELKKLTVGPFNPSEASGIAALVGGAIAGGLAIQSRNTLDDEWCNDRVCREGFTQEQDRGERAALSSTICFPSEPWRLQLRFQSLWCPVATTRRRD